jgi:hypothetical protein
MDLQGARGEDARASVDELEVPGVGWYPARACALRAGSVGSPNRARRCPCATGRTAVGSAGWDAR